MLAVKGLLVLFDNGSERDEATETKFVDTVVGAFEVCGSWIGEITSRQAAGITDSEIGAKELEVEEATFFRERGAGDVPK